MSRPFVDAAAEAFCRQLDAEGADFKVERGPKGDWLFHSDETISLRKALVAAYLAFKEAKAHAERS